VVAGTQSATHWPPALQLDPPAQLPQLTVPPHPSETLPHCRPLQPLRLVVQPHTFAPVGPPPHVSGAVQPPQSTPWPQLSVTVPHLPAQVSLRGVQPHTFGAPPPPQLCGAAQAPQTTSCPQLFLTVPHLPSQVLGSAAQTQRLVVSQVWPVGHDGQLTAGQPAGTARSPHLPPQASVAVGQRQVWLVASHTLPDGLHESPQSSVPPQPFEIVPQSLGPQLFGEQTQVWVAALHTLPVAQVPQSRAAAPQPGSKLPQVSPAGHVVAGVQLATQ